MKILIVVDNNPFFQSNASSNRLISLVKGLKSLHCQVDFMFINGFLTKDEYKIYKEKLQNKTSDYKYLSVFLMKNRYVRKITKKVIPTFYFAGIIKRYILKKRYNYVWLGVSPDIVKVGVKLFKMNLPVKFFHERSEYSWIGLQKKDIHNMYLNVFLKNIDVMSIMTKTLINYYQQYVGYKTSVIHLPMTVDVSRFDIKASVTNLKMPYIAYCGTMNTKKDGVDILINSFIEIMGEFPDYHLYLAGPLTPVEDYNNLLAIINKHDANKRITFLGWMSKDEIPKFLKNASILAMARPESKQSEGGFPTKLGEYLITGNPVCVTNVGEIGDYLSNNISAFISEPDSIDSFSKALKRSIISSDAQAVGQKGKEVAESFFNKDIQSKLLFDFLINKIDK